MKTNELKEKLEEAISELENVMTSFKAEDKLLDSYTNLVKQNARNEVFSNNALRLLNEIHDEL